MTNAFAGFGFPTEAPMGYVFPSEMFLQGSDLTPLSDNFDEFTKGLTEWEPVFKGTGLVEPELISVKGSDYKDFFDKTNYMFDRNLWRDSLPIIPPTEDIVEWILTGTDEDSETVIGVMKPRGGIATVRAIAVALAMAGGRPEYLPLTIASIQAMGSERLNMQSWNATTNSVYPAFVVDGPMAKQIRLGSGYGLLGPNPTYPAGGTIGRAIRFVQQDIGGATPGTGTMAIFGGMRTVNAVFAEDYEDLPEGWTSMAQDMGFEIDQNVVTMTTCNSMMNVLWDFGNIEGNEHALNAMAGCMAAPNALKLSGPIAPYSIEDKDMTNGLALFPKAFVESLASVNGFTKEDAKQYLWEKSKVSYEQQVEWGYQNFMAQQNLYQPGDMVPAVPHPEQVHIAICGGAQGGHGYWMSPFCTGLNTAAEIKLPANWDDLLYQAEIDLGPIPSS